MSYIKSYNDIKLVGDETLKSVSQLLLQMVIELFLYFPANAVKHESR